MKTGEFFSWKMGIHVQNVDSASGNGEILKLNLDQWDKTRQVVDFWRAEFGLVEEHPTCRIWLILRCVWRRVFFVIQKIDNQISGIFPLSSAVSPIVAGHQFHRSFCCSNSIFSLANEPQLICGTFTTLPIICGNGGNIPNSSQLSYPLAIKHGNGKSPIDIYSWENHRTI